MNPVAIPVDSDARVPGFNGVIVAHTGPPGDFTDLAAGHAQPEVGSDDTENLRLQAAGARHRVAAQSDFSVVVFAFLGRPGRRFTGALACMSRVS